ncbi:Uncharacterized protein TPAR_00900 [Tolypocladium paradoxum]|uniref:Uncharacterized protein n=1 Tax=Tolypocladium paradoxum TaxID=94208 RepID=A0A2S4L8Y2_9HYPO|nr:Uncharacterized protein TPAR_00900 [Tolypocladium paradoxum]
MPCPDPEFWRYNCIVPVVAAAVGIHRLHLKTDPSVVRLAAVLGPVRSTSIQTSVDTMRFALLSVLASAAIAVATSANTIAASPATTLSVAWTSSSAAIESHAASPSKSDYGTHSSVISFSVSQSNSTATHVTTTVIPTARPNSTTSHTAEVTGGAIPQQMQASMVGLLGFCIMGLVML